MDAETYEFFQALEARRSNEDCLMLPGSLADSVVVRFVMDNWGVDLSGQESSLHMATARLSV